MPPLFLFLFLFLLPFVLFALFTSDISSAFAQLPSPSASKTAQLIMANPQLSSKRASARFSTYSTAPSVANTVKTSLTSDSAHQEIKDIEEGLDKLENKKLASQRFVMTQERAETQNKLALGAKLERALGRRMGGQDAVMREKKVVSEKDEHEDEKVLVT